MCRSKPKIKPMEAVAEWIGELSWRSPVRSPIGQATSPAMPLWWSEGLAPVYGGPTSVNEPQGSGGYIVF